MIPDSHCSCEDCGPNPRQLSSTLEDNGRLQRQLALSELKLAEALEIAKGLEKKLAIAIKVLKDLSSDYGTDSNGHNLIWDTIEGM